MEKLTDLGVIFMSQLLSNYSRILKNEKQLEAKQGNTNTKLLDLF